MKAIAEFVENSIDAGAKNITITRFRQRGESYLSIQDDGKGVPLNELGEPDFRYVATHICDSLKRQIKQQGQSGIQGEFGIGLLSFWTVGQTLSMICGDRDGRMFEMRMASGDPAFTIANKRSLLPIAGTKLTIGPLLPGIRHLSGEKIQWYLAGELRERIRQNGIQLQIHDRLSRQELNVVPREFTGQLLRQLPPVRCKLGECYVEIYLSEPQPNQQVGLSKSGTRVLESLTQIELFERAPWTSGYFVGVIDAPFLNLTPGTRLGVIRDEAFAEWVESMAGLEAHLLELIEQQQQLASERASRDTFKAIQRAFREALLALPEEEYDWFDIYGLGQAKAKRPVANKTAASLSNLDDSTARTPDSAWHPPGFVVPGANASHSADELTNPDPLAEEIEENPTPEPQQKSFFEHAGPLHSVRISPASCTMRVGTSRTFQARPRDKSGREVLDNLGYDWQIAEGQAELESLDSASLSFTAPAEPQLLKLRVTVTQPEVTSRRSTRSEDIAVTAEALITVTDSMLPERTTNESKRGLPDYTFDKQPGQLWRSRFDAEQNLIVINSGHRDFVYASRQKTLKLRYICRLFAKELVLQNFPGLSADQLLERMIELGLYTEENLR